MQLVSFKEAFKYWLKLGFISSVLALFVSLLGAGNRAVLFLVVSPQLSYT